MLDIKYMVEKTNHIAPYLDAFGAINSRYLQSGQKSVSFWSKPTQKNKQKNMELFLMPQIFSDLV